MTYLVDTDHGFSVADPEDIIKNDYFQAAKRKLHAQTLNKMIRTVDEALKELTPSQGSELTWTMCASLLGYNSKQPTASTNHLWTKAFECFNGMTKPMNMFVGVLVKWRIALHAKETGDTWLMYRQVTDDFDPISGQYIYRSCYFINNDFKVKKR